MFSTFKVPPGTALHQKREKQGDEYDNPLDSARASQVSRPELAAEIGVNFNAARAVATDGARKRKSLFPQERKVSVNPVSTKSPLHGERETAQKFLKKYGATPDMVMKNQSAGAPRHELILI